MEIKISQSCFEIPTNILNFLETWINMLEKFWNIFIYHFSSANDSLSSHSSYFHRILYVFAEDAPIPIAADTLESLDWCLRKWVLQKIIKSLYCISLNKTQTPQVYGMIHCSGYSRFHFLSLYNLNPNRGGLLDVAL